MVAGGPLYESPIILRLSLAAYRISGLHQWATCSLGSGAQYLLAGTN